MIDRIVFPLLLSVIALAPLPFASVYPWCWGILGLACGVMMAAWCVGVAIRTSDPFLPPVLLAIAGAFGAVELWALFQATSISPAAWHHPLWNDAATALGIALPGAIALDPEKAVDGVLRECTYGAVFWLSVQYGRTPRQAKLVVQTISIATVLYALYGLLVYFSGTKTILWYPKPAYLDDLSSTFVNKNHFATYAGLGWLCTLALLYRGWSRSLSESISSRDSARSVFLYIEQTGWRQLLALFLLMGALLYSHSRGGFAATVVGVLVFCLALAINKSVKPKFVKGFGLASLLVALVFFAAGGRTVDQRLASTDLSIEERPHVYELTMTAISDQPLLGSGLGSFEQLFRFYRTPDIHEIFEFAHDSYLETALELGLPAGLALLGCVLVMTFLQAKGARTRRKDSVYPCLGLAASALVGVHSLVDFSVQIPAVAITFSAMLGVATAQSWSSQASASAD